MEFQKTGLATQPIPGYGRSPAPGAFACTREQTAANLAQLAAQQVLDLRRLAGD